jgi:hypothetical protein
MRSASMPRIAVATLAGSRKSVAGSGTARATGTKPVATPTMSTAVLEYCIHWLLIKLEKTN